MDFQKTPLRNDSFCATITTDIFVPEVVLLAGLNVAGSSIRAGETYAGVDGYFTVLTLKERRGQGKAKKLIIDYWIFSF